MLFIAAYREVIPDLLSAKLSDYMPNFTTGEPLPPKQIIAPQSKLTTLEE